MDSNGNPTGRVFNTSTTNDLGEFAITFTTAESYALIESHGFYYNEVTGGLSVSPIGLRAYAALDGGVQNVHVNMVTHLTSGRVAALVEAGETVPDAIATAEQELKDALAVTDEEVDVAGTAMTVTEGDNVGSRYLLATASILAQAAEDAMGPIDAELQSLVNQIATDLEDGLLDAMALVDRIADAKAVLDTAEIMADLTAYLEEKGSMLGVPNIDLILDQDNDTLVNAVDNCDLISNVGQEDTDSDDVGDVCDSYPRGGPDVLIDFPDDDVLIGSFVKDGQFYGLTREFDGDVETDLINMYRINLDGTGLTTLMTDAAYGLSTYLFVSDTHIYLNIMDPTAHIEAGLLHPIPVLYRMNLDGSNLGRATTVFSRFVGYHGFVHINGDYVYEAYENEVRRTDISTGDRVSLTDGPLPDGQFIRRGGAKLLGDTIYWSTEHTIGHVNLDGSNLVVDLVAMPSGPKHKTLHVTDTHIYWPDIDQRNLERCEIDGSNVEPLWVLDETLLYAPFFRGIQFFEHEFLVNLSFDHQVFDYSNGHTSEYKTLFGKSDEVLHVADGVYVVLVQGLANEVYTAPR